MHVLLIGSGGREHALAWKLAASESVTRLSASPGNPGIAEVADIAEINIEDHKAVIDFCAQNTVDLVVVGPEAPLVAGLADNVRNAGIALFGPDAYGAQLEGSKAFTKSICDAANIPTARYQAFTDPDAACTYADTLGLPVVIKADGLAAGKGVVIAESSEAAHTAIRDMLDGQFGSASKKLVIEEFLEGEEASAFFISDGNTVIPFGTAQDHKRAYDGDKGPNTGGMGAYSPAPVLTPALEAEVMQRIAAPTVKAMKEAGHPYIGVLYAGLMVGPDGPKLIEFNCRFGDPECQVLMMRFEGDLAALLYAAATGAIQSNDLNWSASPALTVVMASKGYPGSYPKGGEIKGIQAAIENDPDKMVFHAGTKKQDEKLVSSGGRVLNVTARALTIAEAREKAYQSVERIEWRDGFWRTDIAWRALRP